GLSIMGLQFSVFIGIFAGICNVIPYFGPVLGMIPAFIVGFFTEDFLNGVIAVVILLFVQQIDSNIIYPRVV
ncbi:AI-2E family transporter, partial [Acinetobacter sp. 163]|nr:AI-2E family transporter [Acinetobacter sp. 163]